MTHYDFPARLRSVYDHAIARFKAGATSASDLFGPDQLAWIASIGASAQDFFDYAEDFVGSGDPDWNTALLVQSVRRSYFLDVQKGSPSSRVLDVDALPPKSAAVEGIEWLPRLLPKSLAKLRGELPASLMYGCGGDRRFFKTHDIHPAEFLQVRWRHEDDDDAVVRWVLRRTGRGS